MKSAPFIITVVLVQFALGIPGVGASDGHTCTACGQPIAGAHFETDGRWYHPQHFTCAYCDEPIKGPYTVYREHNYHSRCFQKHVALRCMVCGDIIQGKYLLDYWGNAYHTRHQDETASCDFCERPIVGSLADGMSSFRDGRYLCSICSPSSVTRLDDARDLMKDVADELSHFGIHVDTRVVGLHFAGHNKLRKLSSKRTHGLTGFTDYVAEKDFLGRTKQQTTNIYILYGMPRVQTIATIAHELTHVWQFTNGRVRNDRALSEGSCNFAAYLVLRKLGGDEAEFIIHNMNENRDRVYGDGFRRVKRYVDKHGISGWIRLLKKRKTNLAAF